MPNPRLRFVSLAFFASIVLALACSTISGESQPTATPTIAATRTPTPTRVPPTPSPTPSPTPTPTPVPQIDPGQSIVVGGEVRTRAEPTTQSEVRGTLENLQTVRVEAVVKGENWLVGAQNWVTTSPAWASEWYRLTDGSYVYGAFIFQLGDREISPVERTAGQEKWIDVDISEQVARAMVGERAVYTAKVSTGASPFDTPQGSFAIEADGRVSVERMTATQAGYEPGQAQYDVERVLFTQYFDRSGDAVHLNYWRPSSVFGRTRTSHGCVAMEMHDAQYFWLFAGPGTRVEIHP